MAGPLGLWTVTFLLGLRKIMMMMMSSKQIWQKGMRKVSPYLAAVKNMKGTNNGRLSTANKRGAISKSIAKRVQALFDPEERRATAQRLIDKGKLPPTYFELMMGILTPKSAGLWPKDLSRTESCRPTTSTSCLNLLMSRNSMGGLLIPLQSKSWGLLITPPCNCTSPLSPCNTMTRHL